MNDQCISRSPNPLSSLSLCFRNWAELSAESLSAHHHDSLSPRPPGGLELGGCRFSFGSPEIRSLPRHPSSPRWVFAWTSNPSSRVRGLCPVRWCTSLCCVREACTLSVGWNPIWMRRDGWILRWFFFYLFILIWRCLRWFWTAGSLLNEGWRVYHRKSWCSNLDGKMPL